MTARRLPVPMGECRDCSAPIRFVKLESGSSIPVQPAPGDTGNVAARLVGHRLHGFVVSRDRRPAPQMLRFVPHAAVCAARVERPKREPDPALF